MKILFRTKDLLRIKFYYHVKRGVLKVSIDSPLKDSSSFLFLFWEFQKFIFDKEIKIPFSIKSELTR